MDPFHLVRSYRVLCPKERFQKDKDCEEIIISGQVHHVIKSSYLIFDVEYEKSNHLHSVFCRNKRKGEEGLYCSACYRWITDETYYTCSCCKDVYHKECVESNSQFHSADHPKHSLQLLWFFGVKHKRQCCSCRVSMAIYLTIALFVIL